MLHFRIDLCTLAELQSLLNRCIGEEIQLKNSFALSIFYDEEKQTRLLSVNSFNKFQFRYCPRITIARADDVIAELV